jgi:hypothetical protein
LGSRRLTSAWPATNRASTLAKAIGTRRRSAVPTVTGAMGATSNAAPPPNTPSAERPGCPDLSATPGPARVGSVGVGWGTSGIDTGGAVTGVPETARGAMRAWGDGGTAAGTVMAAGGVPAAGRRPPPTARGATRPESGVGVMTRIAPPGPPPDGGAVGGGTRVVLVVGDVGGAVVVVVGLVVVVVGLVVVGGFVVVVTGRVVVVVGFVVVVVSFVVVVVVLTVVAGLDAHALDPKKRTISATNATPRRVFT